MRRYQFRLEPVLKLRRLKEENCRSELGVLISEMNKIDDQLAHDRREIQSYFTLQEAALKGGVKAIQAQAFPMLVDAKEKNIKLLLRDKQQQQRLIEEKTQELARLRGELKVIENLKEKDFEVWKKAYNKEMDQKIEEQTQNWLQHNLRDETK